MPLWAYIYCGLIIFGTGFNLIDKHRLKRSYQPAGEVMSALCGIAVFLIAYQVIDLLHAPVISSLCFLYTWVWSFHAHRQYLDYQKFKAEHHQWARKTHVEWVEKLKKDHQSAAIKGIKNLPDLDDIDESYDFEWAEKTALYGYIGVILVGVVLVLPYCYVYLKSVGFLAS